MCRFLGVEIVRDRLNKLHFLRREKYFLRLKFRKTQLRLISSKSLFDLENDELCLNQKSQPQNANRYAMLLAA